MRPILGAVRWKAQEVKWPSTWLKMKSGNRTLVPMPTSPLVRFGTSTWTYEGWQGQVYRRQYAKSRFAQECLGEYYQYQ